MVKSFLFSSNFKKNLFVLLGGTAIAQTIPILISPFLTRLFSPDEFGNFASFIALSSFFTVVMSGKYELAIFLPKRDEEAINILSLSFLLSMVLTVISCFLLFFFSKDFADLFSVNKIVSIVWMVPLFSFLSTLFLLFNEWCIRKNKFIVLSKNKISNSSVVSSLSFLFGINKVSFGLIFGQLVGQFVAVILSTYRVLKDDRLLFKYISLRKMKYFSVRYINFAKFNIPGQLINTLAGQLPVFFMSSFFGIENVGFYALTDRVLAVPLSFLGNTFRDVFKQKAAIDYLEQGNCLNIYIKTTLVLVGLSIIPFLVLFFFAPELFSYIFGQEWHVSGEFAKVLCLMYLLSFISMPTSWIFVIAEKQKLDLLWQILFLFFTAISLFIGYLLNDIYFALWSFCFGRCITYLIQIAMTYHLAKGVKSI